MTNTLRTLALLLPILADGCSPPVLAPPPEVPISKRVSVKFGGSWSPSRRKHRELLRRLDLAERVFLELAGGRTPAVRELTLWPRATLPRRLTKGLAQRFRYRGVCRRTLLGAKIHLATSGRNPASALAHELLHARIGDPDHESPLFRRLDRAGRALSLLP